MKNLLRASKLFLLTSVFVPYLGHAELVVVPLIPNQVAPVQNILTVAKSGGDFTDPVEAANSIEDASVTNPYVIAVAPGVYTLTSTLILREHISLTGSGVDRTILSGQFASSSFTGEGGAVVSGAGDSTIRDLTVINTGDGAHSSGIRYGRGTCDVVNNSYTKTAIDNVGVKVYGNSQYRTGIYMNCRKTRIRDVQVDVYGGTRATGVNLEGSSELVLESSEIRVRNSGTGIGVTSDSNDTIRNSEIRVTGSNINTGLELFLGNHLFDDLHVVTRGGTASIGIRAEVLAVITLNESLIQVGNGSERSTGIAGSLLGGLVLHSSIVRAGKNAIEVSFESPSFTGIVTNTVFDRGEVDISNSTCWNTIYDPSTGATPLELAQDCSLPLAP